MTIKNDVFANTREAVDAAIAESGFEDPVQSTGFDSAKEEAAPVEAAAEETPAETGRERGADGKFVKKAAAEESVVEEPVKEVVEEPVKEVAAEKEKEPVKEAAPAKEKEPREDFKVTAEELEVIDKDPNLKKVYRSMVRGFSKKMEETSNLRKEAEKALQAVAEIRADPIAAARAIAASAGKKLEELPTETAAAVAVAKTSLDKARDQLEARVGKDAADILAPVLYEVVQSLMGEELAPVKQTLADREQEAAEQVLKSNISAFGSSVIEDGGEWDEDIEKEMAALITSGEVAPGRGPDGKTKVSLPKFLDHLHNIVIRDRERKHVTSERVLRLREAVTVAEPTRSTRPTASAPEEIVAGMDPKKATALAIAAARREAAGA